MALNPSTKPTTSGTFNGEIRNGWSWVAAANMWLDFSGINIGSTNVVNNLANSGTTTLGLGSPIGLPDYSIKLDTLQEALANNPNKDPFNINVNAGFGNGPEFRNLNTNQLNEQLTYIQPDNVVNQLSYKLITVVVSKSPNRGALYFNSVEDVRSIIPIQTKNIPAGGHKFELKEGDKTHPDIYTIKTDNNVQSIIPMEPTVSLYKNGKVISTINQSDNGPSTFSIQWDTSLWEIPIEIPPTNLEALINVLFDDSDIASLLSYSYGDTSGNLSEEIYSSTKTQIFSITPKTNEYNFKYILSKGGISDEGITTSDKILDEYEGGSRSYNLQAGIRYTLQISASKIKFPSDPVFKTPLINVSSDVISYNRSESGKSLSYTTTNADSVIYSLGGVTRTLPANGKVTITKSDVPNVGTYELFLQPVSNGGGSGIVKKVIINVLESTYIPGPDITHITYPENIIGEDFKGYDVDFKVNWASINTNWVDVWVGKISDSTKLYSKRSPQGELILNIKDVLTKAGNALEESTDVVDFKLLFIPYNDEGNASFAGKTEEITIRFDKGNLKLRRGDVVRDIREVISKQFDTSILKKEDSKYLTHLLHLGEGDNKLISTWGVDTETFSEYKVVDSLTGREEKTKEVKTLVLKLYEPLPKSIQPNQQAWMSKVQSIPLLESITVIDEAIEECTPLQPNFNEKFSDDIGLQIYDDLIASGSTSSTGLVNQFVSGSGFDLKKLDIQFVSESFTYIGSDDTGYIKESTGDTSWYWENFVKYSSAEERVENFIYKVKLIEFYNDRISLVTSGSQYTSSISLFKEKERLDEQISNTINGFDAFEDFLYSSSSINELTYPKENGTGSLLHSTSSTSIAWYENIILSASNYDYNNKHRLVNNLPLHVQNDDEGQEFVLFFDMLGQHFDTTWLYTKSLAKSKKLEHKYQDGISNEFVYQMLESLGWDADMGVQSQALWQYAYGNWNAGGDERGIDKTTKSISSGKSNQNEIWRRILNNLPYLLKHKGTKRALHALMSCYGIPSSLLTVMEFGGPSDTTKGGTTSFTYEDRTASINISSSSKIEIPWKSFEGGFPNSVEVRVNSDIRQDQQIMYGSDWSVDVIQDTGSMARFQLTVGTESVLTDPMPFFNDEYTQIVVNRETGSLGNGDFTLYAKEGFQERIRNEVSVTLSAPNSSWESGTSIFIGNTTFTGSVDEIRLWNTALNELVIENHTLLPDAINGNHSSASSEDLIFRNDFEYPKNRGLGDYNSDPYIKNVAIKQTYASSSIASGFDSILTYPHNYTPYERTVTAQVPQSGFNYSNKVRFETQYNLNGSDITKDDSIGLSYRERSTQKSYDQSPIDSDRLGLFFSPIKEINMDILRSVGPLNIDDYIGDPSDDYNYTYTNLDTFREYYFERYNLNFNEYIQLVRYIDKTLFDQLESLVPARAKVAKGLLIESHILERSKTQWKRPSGEENYHETSVDTTETTLLTTEQNTFLSIVSASKDTKLSTEQPFYDGRIDTEELSIVSSSIANFEGTYVTTDTSNQSGVITRNSGSTMGGFEIDIDARFTASLTSFYDSTDFTQVGGFGPNDLAVAGFGLYGSGSYSIRTRLDGSGNIVKDRVKVFKVKESYQDVERIQISGYPTTTGDDQVVYEVRDVTRYNDFVTILPWDGKDIEEGGNIIEVTPLNGHFSSHYRNVEDLTTGLENSFFNGSKQTQQTTLDGGPAWEIFTTNPNTLRVSDSGRGSGEPILEVD